jgi:DNA polymerase-3 subunit delta
VEKLATPGSQADIFKLVDSLAEGDGRTALRMLKKLLEEQDPLSLFGMVVRQFRLLLQAREVLDEGGNQEAIARELHQPPFVARKLYNQAPHFTLSELESIHRRLLEVDEAAKTSAMPLELSLEILIADLSR